ncbi:MAG: hypothetical protein U0736_24770 [Gemmataceae bacterium]
MNRRGPRWTRHPARWCWSSEQVVPHCQAIQPKMQTMERQYPAVRHLAIKDQRGRPAGPFVSPSSWWPTLVFLRDSEVKRIAVRRAGRDHRRFRRSNRQ